MKAKETLKNDESAIMIFTDGRNLTLNKNGTSASGVWRINKNLSVDKVIVYFRDKSENINKIYVGDYAGIIPSEVRGLEHRFAVEFNNIVFVGETDENWNGFTDTKQGAVSPIKYVR